MNSNSPMEFRERADFVAQACSLLYRRLAVGMPDILEEFPQRKKASAENWSIAVA